MSDYAHDVCFSCRKAWAPQAIRDKRHCHLALQENRPCPDCGKPTIGLGLAFKPPKRNDRRTWRKLETAARAGNRFLKP